MAPRELPVFIIGSAINLSDPLEFPFNISFLTSSALEMMSGTMNGRKSTNSYDAQFSEISMIY